jgi:hypothetical protein
MEIQINEEFDGVFRFTNATDEDFTVLWNNKEYLYPAGTSCPMIISNESLENIQEIRKKFAYKLASREFYKSKEYIRMSKMGGGLPPTFDDKLLQPWIDQCLSPLPKAQAKVKDIPRTSDKTFKGSKAISDKDNPNYVFKDDVPEEMGKMPDTETK